MLQHANYMYDHRNISRLRYSAHPMSGCMSLRSNSSAYHCARTNDNNLCCGPGGQNLTESNGTSARRRVPVACGRCRRRKIRCTGDPQDGSGCAACKTAGATEQCAFLRVQCAAVVLPEHNQHTEIISNGLDTMNYYTVDNISRQSSYPFSTSSTSNIIVPSSVCLSGFDNPNNKNTTRPGQNQDISKSDAGLFRNTSISPSDMDQQVAPVEYEETGLALLASNAVLQSESLKKNDMIPFHSTQGDSRLNRVNSAFSLATPNSGTIFDESPYNFANYFMSVEPHNSNISPAPYAPSNASWAAVTDPVLTQLNGRNYSLSGSHGVHTDHYSNITTAFPDISMFPHAVSNMPSNVFSATGTRYDVNSTKDIGATNAFSALASLTSSLPHPTNRDASKPSSLGLVPRSNFPGVQKAGHANTSTATYPLSINTSTTNAASAKSDSVFTSISRYAQYSKTNVANAPSVDIYQPSSAPADAQRQPFPESYTRSGSSASVPSDTSSLLNRSSKSSVSSNGGSNISSSHSSPTTDTRQMSSVKKSKSTSNQLEFINTTTASNQHFTATNGSHVDTSVYGSSQAGLSKALVLARRQSGLVDLPYVQSYSDAVSF